MDLSETAESIFHLYRMVGIGNNTQAVMWLQNVLKSMAFVIFKWDEVLFAANSLQIENQSINQTIHDVIEIDSYNFHKHTQHTCK